LPASKRFAFHRMALFGFEPFPLRTKVLDFIEHPLQQDLGQGRWNPCPLKLEDLAALPRHLSGMRSISDLT
jgi:hypothetical protein